MHLICEECRFFVLAAMSNTLFSLLTSASTAVFTAPRRESGRATHSQTDHAGAGAVATLLRVADASAHSCHCRQCGCKAKGPYQEPPSSTPRRSINRRRNKTGFVEGTLLVRGVILRFALRWTAADGVQAIRSSAAL